MYDEFGNYIGPDLNEESSDDENNERGRRRDSDDEGSVR